jgi:hypothetical protein
MRVKRANGRAGCTGYSPETASSRTAGVSSHRYEPGNTRVGVSVATVENGSR